ncbi:MAG TPA: tetratricopeptide repeat protein [Candidatus Polarisedimenticolaceae bacterium]|nr:tetratricopeptide repeat protein [Candidatus Polarisedimenticolaceae bacterium]
MRGRMVVATALALTFAFTRPARAVDPHDAMSDFKAGRYLEAVTKFQALVDRSPDYDFGFFMLGHCMLKMRSPGAAEGHFRHAIELNPTRPEYYMGLAFALRDEANWERTIQALTEGLGHTQDPFKRYNLLLFRAQAWYALQRWDQVVADLEVARRIHQDPAVFAQLGKAYFGNGDPKAAIQPLRFALESSPDDTGVLRVLSESYIRIAADETDVVKKKILYGQALEFAQRLSSLTPDDMDAMHLVGRAALGAGQLDKAESVFRHVLDREPRQCYAMINLGRTFCAAQKYPEAKQWLQRAEACAPRLGLVYETLGDLYLKMGLPDEAANAFRRADDLSPDDDTLLPPGRPRPSRDGTISVSAPR